MRPTKMWTAVLVMTMMAYLVQGQQNQSYPGPSPYPNYKQSPPSFQYPQPNSYSRNVGPYAQYSNQNPQSPVSYSQPPNHYAQPPNHYAPNPYQPQRNYPTGYPPAQQYGQYPSQYPQNAYPQPKYPIVYSKEPEDCTDWSCNSNECCESNGKRRVCIAQDAATLPSNECVRPKRCYNNGDCPTGHCCVIRLDVPFYPDPPTTYTGYSSNYGYNSDYNSGYDSGYNSIYHRKGREERGECILTVPTAGLPCRRTVDGIQTSVCPCAAGLNCVFASGNLVTGVCT